MIATSLKGRCKLYASLYVSCQGKQGDLVSFFSHMNNEYPPSLSEYGKIRKISSLMADENPPTDAYVIGGPVFVHEYKPTVSNTYGQYCKQELTQKVKDIARDVDRVDLVFDVYRTPSIKRETRESRGSGIRVSVRSETPLAKNTWSKRFLKKRPK